MEDKRKWLVLAIIIFIMVIVNSCDGNEEQTKPTCTEACPEIQRDHLGINETCTHNDKTIQGACECTEQTTVIVGTTIPISKAAGVTVAQMNAAVVKVNKAYTNGTNGGQKTTFQGKVSGVRVVAGNTTSFNNGVWSVGYNADEDTLIDDIINEVLVAVRSHQLKTEWLASNKNRECVGELMEAGTIVRVNAFDMAHGISI